MKSKDFLQHKWILIIGTRQCEWTNAAINFFFLFPSVFFPQMIPFPLSLSPSISTPCFSFFLTRFSFSIGGVRLAGFDALDIVPGAAGNDALADRRFLHFFRHHQHLDDVIGRTNQLDDVSMRPIRCKAKHTQIECQAVGTQSERGQPIIATCKLWRQLGRRTCQLMARITLNGNYDNAPTALQLVLSFASFFPLY